MMWEGGVGMKTKLCVSSPNPQQHSTRAYPITNSKINDKTITPNIVPYGYHTMVVIASLIQEI
jgi:hypothetical protein